MILTETEKTIEKMILRIRSLSAVGVYELLYIVRQDGTKELIIKNQGQPHPVERLGK
jgi:hypothetical protein